MDTTPSKPGWDKRAWRVGLFWGNFFALIAAWSSYPTVQHKLDAALPFHSSGIWSSIAGGDLFSILFGCIGILILPGILSGIARRLTFLWGLLPIMLMCFWTETVSVVEKAWNELRGDFWPMLAVTTVSWLLSSGPVSAYRYSKVRAERKRLAMQAQFEAQRAGMSVAQPGVWPPPPNYRGDNPNR